MRVKFENLLRINPCLTSELAQYRELLTTVQEQQAVIEQMQGALLELRYEAEQSGLRVLHKIDNALTLQSSSDILKLRDQKRDAALLWEASNNVLKYGSTLKDWHFPASLASGNPSWRLSDMTCFVESKDDMIKQLRARARVAELEAQLAERDRQLIAEQVRADANAVIIEHQNKLLLLAKEALVGAISAGKREDGDEEAWYPAMRKLNETLRAINDSKIVEGLVLCDAEPVCYTNEVELEYLTYVRADEEPTRGVFWENYSEDSDVPLYAARRTDK
jgi:hypothetical protein